MPQTLFISDLHLDPTRPAMLELCRRFLEGPARQAEALYILGDLFEAWLGDDDDEIAYATVKQALRELSAAGTPVFMMHGNRDFLLGAEFARETGCTLLSEPYLVDLYATPTLLLHGDTLCTGDQAYQQLRQQVRNPLWQRQILAKSLTERRAIAQYMRAQSRQEGQSKADYIMDVDPAAVTDLMRQHGVARLIHGHTHRPAIHRFDLDGRPSQRVVLGDWEHVGSVLVVTPQGLELQTLAAPPEGR